MSEISNAMKHICEEKGLSYDAVLGTIESALAAAYRKDFGQKNQNIVVNFDPETAKSKVYDVKLIVEDLPEEELEEMRLREEARAAGMSYEEYTGKTNEAKKDDEDKPANAKNDSKADESEKTKGKKDSSAGSEQAKTDEDSKEEEEEERKFNPKTEIQISDAKLIKKTAKIGDELKVKLDPPDEYGRMAAQTAKQVIIQRLREAEREMIFNDFKDKEGEVVSGVIQRREGRVFLIDLGKAIGILTPDEQISGERYNIGDRVKVYVKEVNLKPKGPEILLSRTSEEILKKVFYLEIPEISNGLIELKGVAREAGSRSKVAVFTDSDNVDPIGSCVGQRGARIQTIINELGGEKVDIIEYDEDPAKFISNALSPAKILSIDTNEEEEKATVKVANDQLSLAIGKGGQNARLAARLTDWKVDIVEDTDSTVNSKPQSSDGAQQTTDDSAEDSDKKPEEDKKNTSEENNDNPKEDKELSKKVKKKLKEEEKENKKKEKEEKKATKIK